MTPRAWVPLVSGFLFAAGLALSGMTQPAKVIAFLDVTGRWDPSLALVMVGAIGVHLTILLLARSRSSVVAAAELGSSTGAIDVRTIGGAALFGIGWGISGYCPGPAVVSAASASAPALVVLGSIVAGIALHDFVLRRVAPSAASEGACGGIIEPS